MSDRRRQRLRTVITIIATALIIAPAAALAGHQFSDVPNSNVFHDDIEWMRDNGVTKGCNPPDNTEYCPDDNVTREQMAAFMHRLETENVFVRPGDDAVDGGNADTVDGMHANDFLGANDKAVDSDKLEGKDSTAFVETADNAAEWTQETSFVAVGSSDTTVVSINVPAGTYVIFAKGLANNNDSTVESMDCSISGPSATDEVGAMSLDVDAEADRIPFSLMVPATFTTDSTVDLVCSTSASAANVGDSALTAIPVSSVNIQD